MSTPKIVQESIDFLDTVTTTESGQRQREIDDLKFQVGSLQWPDEVKSLKGPQTTAAGDKIPAEPMLSVSTLDEPLQLAYNQFTSAHLGVNVHPLNEDASDDTAKVIQGLYRSIEVGSRANIARGWAYDRSMKSGRGVYRVHKEPDLTTGVPGDQKLVIKRVLQQSSVFLDPFAQQPDWSDGERAIELEEMPVTTYKRKYKKTKLAGFDDASLTTMAGQLPKWIGGKTEADRTITIAGYWYVEHDTQDMVLEGAKSDGSDYKFQIDKRTVKCAKVNAIEILEEYEWDGKYIPLIPVVWKELQPFDTERRWIGMIHNAKDGVRLTNYAASGAVLMASLEPQAPWIMEEGQDENYKDEYQLVNRRKFPVLHYKARGLSGEVSGPPKRVQVDVARLGPNMQLLQMGKQFVESATATYGPARGEQTPAHRSGKAIDALIDQTANATSGGLDNLANISMTYEAMVILDLIPKVYDRPGRVAKILDGDNKPRSVILNQPFRKHPDTGKPVAYEPLDGEQTLPDGVTHYDLSKGLYGVTVKIGKSFQSQLDQGSTELGDIMQADPALVPLIGPVYFKYRDGPGMREVGEILQKQRDHAMPWLADNPQDPAIENTQLKANLQQATEAAKHFQGIAEGKMAEQQAKMAITQVQEQHEDQRTAAEVQAGITKAEIAASASTANAQAKIDAENFRSYVDAMENRLSEQLGLHMKKMEQLHEVSMAHKAAAVDAGQAALAHMATLQQGDQAHGQALEQGQQAADLAPTPATNNGDGQ